jgi:Zn-dependent peptidase ImmA (M78 family)
MPQDSVRNFIPDSPLPSQIIEAKKIWKVAAMALTYRLHDLGMLSDWHYRKACIELSKKGYRSMEHRGIPTREKSQLLEKVFSMAHGRGITTRHVADELDVSTQELNSWIFGLVVTVRAGSGRSVPSVVAPRPRLSIVR